MLKDIIIVKYEAYALLYLTFAVLIYADLGYWDDCISF